MKNDQRPPVAPRRTQDIMEFYRERIMYLLAIAVALFITPFAVLNIMSGHYLLAAAVVGVVVTFCVDGFAIHLKRRPPIPFIFLLFSAVLAIGLAVWSQGLNGALWCYPGVLLFYFILPRRLAIASSLVLLAAAAPVVLFAAGQEAAERFTVSLALTIAVTYIITDVIRDLQRELLDQVVTDPLTGAYNRRQMEFTLDESIERHQRTGAPVSILLIDIDHFKRVNDDFGHDAGDRVLKALVLLVKNRTRKLDRLFRMGGEEFLLYLPDTPVAAAMKQAENLRMRIAEGALLKQRQITVSVGVAEYRLGMKQEDWLKIADNALYKAKNTGRNRVISGHDLEGEPDPPSVVDPTSGERRAHQR